MGPSHNSGWTDIGPRSAFATYPPAYDPPGQSGPTIGHPQNVTRPPMLTSAREIDELSVVPGLDDRPGDWGRR